MSKKKDDTPSVIELTQVLFKHYPKMMDSDLGEHARAAAALTSVLGGVMAIFLRDNPEVYEKLMERVVEGTKQSAQSYLDRAKEIKDKMPKQDPYGVFKH